MKCPYRNKVVFKYIQVCENKFLLTSQTEEMPDCYESECPYYNPTGLCNKILEDEE